MINFYESDLGQFRKVVSNSDSFQEMISFYITWLNDQGYKDRTVNRKLSVLHSFVVYLINEGVLEESVALSFPKIKQVQRLPHILESLVL